MHGERGYQWLARESWRDRERRVSVNLVHVHIYNTGVHACGTRTCTCTHLGGRCSDQGGIDNSSRLTERNRDIPTVTMVTIVTMVTTITMVTNVIVVTRLNHLVSTCRGGIGMGV